MTLGLCSQTDLDHEVRRAAKEKPLPVVTGATLLPASETTKPEPAPVRAVRHRAAEKERAEAPIDVDSVFAKLGGSASTEAPRAESK